MHTTPNFSSCSQSVQNRFISKCVLYWFATIFLPVSAEPIKLLHTRASLSTPIGTCTTCIKARPRQTPAPALLWFPKEGCMCAVQRGAVKHSSQVPHDAAIWISSHSETHASSSACTQAVSSKAYISTQFETVILGMDELSPSVSFLTFLHQLLPKLLCMGKLFCSLSSAFLIALPAAQLWSGPPMKSLSSVVGIRGEY